MPGTITRLARDTLARSGLRGGDPLDVTSRSRGVHSRRHVAVLAEEPSPFVTGFPGFTTALLGLLEERAGRISRPLQDRIGGTPDVVVAVLPGPGPAAAAVQLANRFDVPLLVIVQAQTTPPETDADTPGAQLTARLDATALERANRWAVTGEAARSRLTGLGIRDGVIDPLPYWVRPAPARPADADTERDAARARLGWPTGFLVVCPVGADARGPAALLPAARLLADRGCDARLVLVGRGPRLRELRAEVDSGAGSAQVEVLEIAARDYPAALVAADLVLVADPPRHPDPATAGRFAAALAAGRPVLAAIHHPGPVALELNRAEGTTVLVEPGAPGPLADAIEVLYRAPAARAVMSAAARHYTRVWLSPAAAGRALDATLARTLKLSAGSGWWGRSR